jgi:ABC-type uncharacterized transport system permease subunit
MTFTAMIAPILAAAIRSGTAILLATVGEIFAERAGVLNLGVEGMMLVGAIGGFATSFHTGSPWLGLAAGALAGGLLSLIHAFLSVTLRVNQVVSGLALTIFGMGVSGFYGQSMVGQPAPGFLPVAVPLLSEIPFLGEVFFRHDAVVYLSFAVVGTAWVMTYRTRSSLNLRAVGENPLAADAMGLNVARIRYRYVFTGGLLAGAGGAYLSLAQTRMWVQNLTAGQGWIAIALVIFALWNPLRAAVGAYLFGGINALQMRLQAWGTVLPVHLLLMLPYVLTVAVLIVISARHRRDGSSRGPAALGLPFFREDRSPY